MDFEEQQFCLRWNNFQANITSQFETLRDDEDFTDVTIACEGQRLKAHKVVLSACSPFFKDLFKNNPCSHPIIFMRDVEAKHIIALLEFMYAGEVNVAQAQLSNFLKTAESLRIRGLTDTGTDSYFKKDDDNIFSNEQEISSKLNNISSSTAVTSSQDLPEEPHPKPSCTSEEEIVNPFELEATEHLDLDKDATLEPKIELPEYSSEEEGRDEHDIPVELIPQLNQSRRESNQALRIRHRRLSDPHWSLHSSSMDDSSCFRKRSDGGRRNRLVKLGEGIEIYEDQLHSIKWNDYRKLTRGLATILFSPAELATCSVTGQRWSRAGSGERPVKPALDRAKVQAIISYVATRFPMIEISRIKQVLAYKCKENSTAFKMKAVRYYREQDK